MWEGLYVMHEGFTSDLAKPQLAPLSNKKPCEA